VPVMERLRRRFGLRQITVVADRGMVSQATLAALSVGFVLKVLC
jgi:DNA-binding transcriptional regulator LsrR (DeoR family)